MVALLFMGSAILLYSCKEERQTEVETLENVMTEQSDNLTIVVSENGRKAYRFTTPLLEGYTLGRDPYREFRKGVSITTYQDDSLTTVNATLVSDYAIYYEKRKLWEAKGNVKITKHDGTRLYTQQLFWDSMTKRIYSNVDTKIVTVNDTHFCEGFESDEDLVELKFRRWKGKMQMEEGALTPSKDSVQTETTAKPASRKEQSRESVRRKEQTPKKPNRRWQGEGMRSKNKRSTERLQ